MRTKYQVRNEAGKVIGGSNDIDKCYELIDAQELELYAIEMVNEIGQRELVDTTIPYAPNS